MDAQIVSLSQDVSFEDGSITNFISLRLPSGHIIRAVVGDDSARILVETASGVAPPPPVQQQQQVIPQPRQHPLPSPPAAYGQEEEGAVVFGGGEPEDEDQPRMWLPPQPDTVPTPPPPPEQPVYQDAETQAREYRRQKQKAPRNPLGTQNGRHIGKDSMGYPVVANNGGVDPATLVGTTPGGTVDEDGVGQY